MTSNKDVSNELLKGIQYLIKEELKKAPVDQTTTGVIKKLREDNLYDVLIGKTTYTNIPSIFKGLYLYDTVKIKIPQGQYSQMYIEGKYNLTLESGGGTTDVNWSDIIGIPDDLVQDSNYVHTDNNYTTTEKNKLNNIQDGAEVNVQSDWNENDSLSDSYIKNKPNIPSKTSELVNDSQYVNEEELNNKGYLTEEQDPTVPQYVKDISELDIENWNNKSNFSGDYNDLTNKPLNLSDFSNDVGFITNTVNNLTNYYTKSITYTKEEVNSLISGIITLNILVVENLPTSNISTTTIYLLRKKDIEENNIYDEYINTNGTSTGWELIGSTKVDLSNYYTIAQVDNLLLNKVDKVEGKQLSTNDFTNSYKTNVDSNTSARHTHNNKSILDGIDNTDIENWNNKLNSDENAVSATKLQTPRKIAGTSFDGTNDIAISYNNLIDKPNIPSGVIVVDNLTSNLTTSALSANQGRVLKNYLDNDVIVSSAQPSGQLVGDIWYEEI